MCVLLPLLMVPLLFWTMTFISLSQLLVLLRERFNSILWTIMMKLLIMSLRDNWHTWTCSGMQNRRTWKYDSKLQDNEGKKTLSYLHLDQKVETGQYRFKLFRWDYQCSTVPVYKSGLYFYLYFYRYWKHVPKPHRKLTEKTKSEL